MYACECICQCMLQKQTQNSVNTEAAYRDAEHAASPAVFRAFTTALQEADEDLEETELLEERFAWLFWVCLKRALDVENPQEHGVYWVLKFLHEDI